MRAETWMDRRPDPPTPLERARKDVEHWRRRLAELATQLPIVQKELDDALDTVDRLERKAAALKTA